MSIEEQDRDRGGRFAPKRAGEADIDLGVSVRDELLAHPMFSGLPDHWLTDKTEADLAKAIENYDLVSSYVEAELSDEERPAWPEWLPAGEHGDRTTDDGYRVVELKGPGQTDFLVRPRDGYITGHVAGPQSAVDWIEKHRLASTRDGVTVFSDEPQPPSKNRATGDFARVATIRELTEAWEGLTSPENLSGDGEISPAAANRRFAQLSGAYVARRRELDPADEKAYCFSCGRVVAGLNGETESHRSPVDPSRACA